MKQNIHILILQIFIIIQNALKSIIAIDKGLRKYQMSFITYF